MGRMAQDPRLAERMGAQGRRRVIRLFASDAFAAQLDGVVRDAAGRRTHLAFALVVALSAALAVSAVITVVATALR